MDFHDDEPNLGIAAFAAVLRNLAPRVTSTGVIDINRATVLKEINRADTELAPLIRIWNSLSEEELSERWESFQQLNSNELSNIQTAETSNAGEGGGEEYYEWDTSVASTDTPFRLNATSYASRSLHAIGSVYSVLSEASAMCDVCKIHSPCVLDHCRSSSGDRLCDSCDSSRHEKLACSDRWVCIRSGSFLGIPRLLRPNEVVCKPPESSSVALISASWINERGKARNN